MPAAYDPKNLFKQIIDGTIPSHRIFETKHAVAILDAFPTVDGHALLLPKHPCADVMDMPADVAASVLKELPRLARLVKQATGADGVNIVQNSGKSAGQVVFHCHFHVIPRFDGDAKPVAFAAGRKAMLSGEEGAAMLGRMKEPYAQSISAIDDFLGAMRAGAVDSPAAVRRVVLARKFAFICEATDGTFELKATRFVFATRAVLANFSTVAWTPPSCRPLCCPSRTTRTRRANATTRPVGHASMRCTPTRSWCGCCLSASVPWRSCCTSAAAC
tara:strand:- start:109 stop:930 length:822 start_codon:yes stop_codon:yes gene_type:complete